MNKELLKKSAYESEIPDALALMELETTFGAHNYSPLPVILSKAQGVWVWDIHGKKYLDCLASYSAVNHGHRHPKIIQALQDQLNQITITSRAFHHDKFGIFCQKLAEFCHMEQVLPMNTGAEAVETAIKIVRRWGYHIKKVTPNQAEIIVCENNFHGRTTTIVGFSSDPISNDGFGPKTPGFTQIPFNDLDALQRAITPNTVGFLMEPIQGEAGVIVPTPGYLRNVKEICQQHQVLLITDEIQTGFGRTGKTFAFEHDQVFPDILCVGKALGGGIYPVSAALTSRFIMDVITPGSHGSTFGGNPLACAVGLAAMQVLDEEQLVDRSAKNGAYFLKRLKEIQSPIIREVRGKGLMIGVEFSKKFGSCRPIAVELMKQGILVKDTHESTIRFTPPLVIDREIIDWALEVIEKVIHSAFS